MIRITKICDHENCDILHQIAGLIIEKRVSPSITEKKTVVPGNPKNKLHIAYMIEWDVGKD